METTPKDKYNDDIDAIISLVDKIKDRWQVTIYMDNGDIYPDHDDLMFLHWEHSVYTDVSKIEITPKKLPLC